MEKISYDELIKKLHQYTPQEQVLKDHPEIRNNPKLIKQFNDSLTEHQKKTMLVPIADTNKDLQTFLSSFFFKKDDPLKVKIVKHNRYTTPIMHNHDFYELFYVYEGQFKQQIGNQIYEMNSGDLCLIPPDIYHELNVNNSSIVLNILIAKSTFQEIFLNNLVGNNVFANFFKQDFYKQKITNFIIFPTYGDEEIKKIIIDMDLELNNQDEYYVPVVHSLLLLLLSLSLRKYGQDAIIPKQGKQNQLDLQILKIIDKEYATITLNDLSRRLNYSEQYLTQRLKNTTGLSFEKYLLSQRMKRAGHLLRNTKETVNQIGELTGYQNPATFIRAFKRYYQMTPTEFRKKDY